MANPTPEILDAPDSERSYGYVVCRAVRIVSDSAADQDSYPDAVAALGSVTFSPREKLKTTTSYSAFVSRENLTFPLNARGELYNPNSVTPEIPGAWLTTGVYEVTFSLSTGSIKPITIEVTSQYTVESPLDLVSAAPYVPPVGASLITMLVPQSVSDGSVLIKQGTKFSGIPVAEFRGDPGPSANLTIGNVTTVESDVPASASISGEAPNQTLDLVIPNGRPGPPGPSGGALEPISTAANTPDGSAVGDLRGYLALADVTVNGLPLTSGQIAVFFWDGSAWQVASAGGAAAVEPPVWASGTTAMTGTPTDTQVEVTFSQPIPSGRLQVRYGTSDVWRDVPKMTASSAVLSGLSPLTAYPVPQFRVVNAAGASAVVSAQAFTTAKPAPTWQTTTLAEFSAPDGTLIEDYQPDLGPRFTRIDQACRFVIVGGRTQIEYTGSNWATGWAEVVVPATGFDVRATAAYTGLTHMVVRFKTNIGAHIDIAMQPNWVDIAAHVAERVPVSIPSAGVAVVTITGSDPWALHLVAAVGGVPILERDLSLPTNYGRPARFAGLLVCFGGSDLHTQTPVGAQHVDSLRVECLQ